MTNPEPQEPTPLVIDTDTGSDDAVALLLAAASGLGRIVAVTTVAGNVPVAQATRNALYTLELAGAGDVPVYQGSHQPLVRPPHTAQGVHGHDGMGDSALQAPTSAPRPDHAVDALARLAHPGVTLVTLGPLTNIAAALARERSLLARFRHVYCMAGAADGVGNISPTAEFNVWADPEAAAMVLAAAQPEQVTWIGWDVSRRDAVMAPADQLALRSLGTPLATFADRINQTVNEWSLAVTGLAGYDLPDPIAMAIALRPALIARTEQVHVRVALGDEARGQLLIDRRRTAPSPNITLVRNADATAFKSLLFDTLATPVPHALPTGSASA